MPPTPPTPSHAPSRRPLAVSSDPDLLEDVVRVGAEAGVELEAVTDLAAAATGWSGAPVVVVGAASAAALVRTGWGPRPGLLVVARDADDARVWQDAAALQADAVLVLPLAERLLGERLAAATQEAAAAATVAVVPGCGGAGASTLAAALATTAARHPFDLRPLLVDADPWGGGLDLLLGAEAAAGCRWPALVDARGGLGAEELRSALPRADGVTVLSWDRGPHVDLPVGAAEAVVAAGRRAHGCVVLDVPARPDPVRTALLRRADLAVLVVTADVRSAAAAARVAATLDAPDVRVVVRSTRAARLPGPELAGLLGLPLAGTVASEPSVRSAAHRGEPPGRSGRGSLARLCRSLLDDLAGAGTGLGRAA